MYATPKMVANLADCRFYHTMEIPGYGLVEGQFDLRGREADYLGHVLFEHKRVLELGPASGYLTFHMERKQAEVVAYDLSEDQDWDIVPYARQRAPVDHRSGIRHLNNGFWLAHRANESRARVVYGTAYDVPAGIGPVDVVVLGCILQHLRDPFRALELALRLTRETAIVTELRGWYKPGVVASAPPPPAAWAKFIPDAESPDPWDTWWILTPELVQRFFGVLGFEESHVSFHMQKYRDIDVPMFTVVGRRTVPLAG